MGRVIRSLMRGPRTRCRVWRTTTEASTEVWPLQNIVPVTFCGHTGYEFDASTRWLGNGYRLYMYDYYSATTYSADVYVPSSYYSGDSAEAIAERPKVNGSLTNLSNFGTITFQTTRANGIGIDNWSSTAGRHGASTWSTRAATRWRRRADSAATATSPARRTTATDRCAASA